MALNESSESLLSTMESAGLVDGTVTLALELVRTWYCAVSVSSQTEKKHEKKTATLRATTLNTD